MPRLIRTVLAALCALTLLGVASAHLMVAQRGTLNVVDNGAFIVMSLPVSALKGVDDDGDGSLSTAELSTHTVSIGQQVKAGLQLTQAGQASTLEGLLMDVTPPEGQTETSQLVVMGRYALADGTQPFTLTSSLWGDTEAERSLNITATRGEQKSLLILTPNLPQGTAFQPAGQVLTSYLKLGGEHVLSGLDHLLFLLVVVSAGWGWRRLFLALSVFTVGHAVSLAAVVFGGLSAPASIVEPAIAATIVGLALYDRWVASRTSLPPINLRLGLVFACSLIHGLGLGGALLSLGLDPARQGLSILGFNLGIEAGQLGVALLALGVLAALRGLFGARGQQWATGLATVTAVVVGGVWFVQRVALG
ncbi:HupE/UreJ family protein [Deinococcus arenicola]|uniref:HupE/UreJ family protein n=1 Tax=Deinococcus arenicola TaxID=2994950 RepID=A0ABU4DY31_9DEIO|nr:HupE/UreJ family protein [Deinococcus sp. ZS9-10]MDV6376609.1 HupE/UreJ family protein [Deinococcus sp. ZS9-10]